MTDGQGMADQRSSNRSGGRPSDTRPDDRQRDQKPRDPGAYIGRMPERQAETIPGGVGRKDVRVAAVATQPAPVSGSTPADGGGAMPEGHREGVNATDDVVREAGQNR
jgi:hypothetical protein